MTFETVAEIKAANEATGQHWFDVNIMWVFGTRIATEVIGGRYFISSDDTPRFTVRVAADDGRIDTIGEFREHETLGAAIEAAKTAAGIT